MSFNHKFIEKQNLLEVTYHWFEPYHKGGFCFFVVWDFLSISLFYPEMSRLIGGEILFPRNIWALSIFIMLVFVPTYWMFLFMLNRTTVRLTMSKVMVRHGPLPGFRENVTIAMEEIQYIWIEERFPDSEEDESRDVKAILKNGEERMLFLNIQIPSESQMIRTRMNNWLVEVNRLRLTEERKLAA